MDGDATVQDPDLQHIRGTWRIVAASANPYAIGALEVYSDRHYRWLLADPPIQSNLFQFRIDSSADPKQIDLISDEGVLLGIYQLNGDTFVTCFADKHGELRPTAFESNKNPQWNLGVMTRESDDESPL